MKRRSVLVIVFLALMALIGSVALSIRGCYITVWIHSSQGITHELDFGTPPSIRVGGGNPRVERGYFQIIPGIGEYLIVPSD